jgi:hypothetical protein
MVRRRTKARLDFLAQSLDLGNKVRQWRAETDTTPFRKRAFLFGVIYRVVLSWVQDRDIGGLRTNRLRRTLLTLTLFLTGGVAGATSRGTSREFSLGATCGRLAYRLWFGVLHPPLGDDD